MEIRRARPDDAPGIAAAEELIFPDPWGEKDIFSIPNIYFIVLITRLIKRIGVKR